MNKKVFGLMNDELGGKITIECVSLRPKTYSYLMDANTKNKKAKRTKKFVIKKHLNLILMMIVYLITSQYCNHNKDLKVNHIIYILNK